MVCARLLAVGAVLSSSVLALPKSFRTDPTTEHNPVRQFEAQADRAQAVADVFKTSWEGYYKYAFPNDELKPVTNGASNSRNGWGASAVDALSTALIMGEKEIVNQIITYIPVINFGSTGSEVSLFETTIRYLGGMLSGYDLLSGPLAHLANNKADVEALLTQSIHLANNLSFAFESPSGIPYNNLDLEDRRSDRSNNGLATVGTLILEWVRLSDLSGNATYAKLVEKAESYLLKPTPAAAEPFPGLVGMSISPEDGTFKDVVGGWIGGADSFYEYLLKMYIYSPTRYAPLKERFVLAADSTITYLTSHPAPRPDITFVAMYRGTQIIKTSQHLACFHAGQFILAGQVLNSPRYIQYGLELVNGCHEVYIQTATHIGPEQFSWDSTSVPPAQAAFFNRTGFYIDAASYQLRPEVIESYYYAYRATGDKKYQDWAWDAFVAINATTRVGSGYSSIADVNVEGGGEHTDFQESFWFAEVLKYSYLIQTAGGEEWQVGKGGRDRWVFNTEAHPVRVAYS
ncbi:glycoside hydrolase [Ophiobolus disseminans]|uniref:alpha-1,2-Mannosidase n=1 Tax=Ophiobolus disseminans TaxID=1469910 RepID=A0A6A6ZUK5_9PLEO|nr:glycoside hydrolase [Ophiobolus disseminans]